MVVPLVLSLFLSSQIIIGIGAKSQFTDSLLIISQSGLGVGEKFTQQDVQNAVHRIYSLGFFSQVEVDTTMIGDGVKVRFLVREFPRLKKIEFSGNRKIKTKELIFELTNEEGPAVLRPVETEDYLYIIMPIKAS